ncbi:MAG TPA: class I fructose-bisphosphate aldolase [Patescibacteria group bacterium]|nr:class I fructose-bisphosphate aldolase [Patescibacteria group bacterium]
MDELENLAKALVTKGKGILAADESFPTIEKRFTAVGISSTQEARRAYREMLFTTQGIENFISGVIMFDETSRDKTSTGENFTDVLIKKGIIPGIKVDQGMEDMAGYPGDKLTDGLTGLKERLVDYKELKLQFTKWRAAFSISEVNPSIQCVEENANRLAEYASIAQSSGFVPIVEPEVLMDGSHTIDKCYEVTRSVLRIVFMKLKDKNVNFRAMLLKPNMVLPGSGSGTATSETVAQKTIEVLKDCVPQEIPGIVFLSGGQSEEEAANNLREMNKRDDVPWELSFSFGRALQNSALEIWKGNPTMVKDAQDKFLEVAKVNSNARNGK